MKSFDVVVVGAGIVGCAVALECAQANLRVAVVDSHPVGSGATAAGMGHLLIMDDSPAQFTLTKYSLALWQQMADELPSAVEYEERGTLWVAADEEEMAEVHAKHKRYSAAAVPSQVLDGAELATAEPNLRPGLAGALLVPGDAVIYPPAAASFFLQKAQAMGATFLAGANVITAAAGELRLADGTPLRAERIVLATGAAVELLPSLPLRSRKGHLLITERYPGFVHHPLVELGYLKSAHSHQTDSVAFNAQPRRTGQILIGSSRQYGKEDAAIDAAMLTTMMQRALLYLPDLGRLSALRAWTGFRASTPDNLPLIGPASGLSDDPSLWLAAGFEGLGITNATGAARLLVDGMLGRAPAIAGTPYLPQRVVKPEHAHA